MTGRVWFTSDHHFGHARICEFAGRPFGSVDEMNETLVERWNETVALGDTVFHLGDFAMGQIKDTLPTIARLNGKVSLVPGNHDRCSSVYPHKNQRHTDWIERYLQAGFHRVLTPSVLLDPADYTGLPPTWRWMFQLNHFPFAFTEEAEERYPEARPKFSRGRLLWLIHGHIHNREQKWRGGKVFRNRQMVNVSVEAWDYRPASIEEICALIDPPESDTQQIDRIKQEIEESKT